MKTQILFQKLLAFFLVAAFASGCGAPVPQPENVFTDFFVNPKESRVEFFWKDENGNILRSIENLKNQVSKNGKRLRFAMNGGMYQEDNKPLGLFIQNRKTITPLNTRTGGGNFYLQPNGVFYLTSDRRAFIKQTHAFDNSEEKIEFATQSGPMLIVDGAINEQFKPDSNNINIRNGVCVTENGVILFSISRREINFYNFAEHFQQAGCRDALYLDGFVSRIFLPEKGVEQIDGDFGVIIGVVE